MWLPHELVRVISALESMISGRESPLDKCWGALLRNSLGRRWPRWSTTPLQLAGARGV